MSAFIGCSKHASSLAIMVSSCSEVQSLSGWSTIFMSVVDVSVCTISPSAPSANWHLPRPMGKRSEGVPVNPMRFANMNLLPRATPEAEIFCSWNMSSFGKVIVRR